MVGIDIRFQLANYISEVRQQGILDQYFDTLMQLRCPDDPTILVDSIDNFIVVAQENIQELHRQMSYPVIKFDEVMTHVNRLRANSSCIGGGKLADDCLEMLRACQQFDQKVCDGLFSRVREQYRILVRTLKIIHEMEEVIVKAEMRRQKKLQNESAST